MAIIPGRYGGYGVRPPRPGSASRMVDPIPVRQSQDLPSPFGWWHSGDHPPRLLESDTYMPVPQPAMEALCASPAQSTPEHHRSGTPRYIGGNITFTLTV